MPQTALTADDIQEILSLIDYPDHEIRLIEKSTVEGEPVFLLQLRYMEEDVDDPEAGPVLQAARKWYISAFSTRTEVVETVYAAALRSAKHRVREHFRYRGEQVFNPHFDIEARVNLCKERRFDGRNPL